VLTQTLALAHPIIPFVTEEIYSYIPGAEGMLAAGIPDRDAETDDAAEASLGRLIEAVQALRAWRDSASVKAGATLSARLVAEGYDHTAEQLARMARLSLADGDGQETAASVAIPGGTVEIAAGDGLDLEAASRKLAARRAQLESDVQRSERKLANQGFVSKAPPEVVAAERDKLARLRAELEAL
jgi:valyl-tRNA synthetase